MSSCSLAVKYRPKSFAEVIGQDRAVSTLKGLVKSRNINRAILLVGPTGVGKSTLSRIVARSLNCENFNQEASTVCGVCDYCKSTESLTEDEDFPGVEEFNASDTRGIDSVRSIVDTLQYEPTTKTRVIILDEMHNMTSQAQNAILKPLEKPTQDTLFILVTTEDHKVLPQIRDRCLPVVLTKVNQDTIFKHLNKICKDENKDIDSYGLKYISENCGGIVRRAVTYLEELLYAKELDPEADVSSTSFLSQAVGKDAPFVSVAQFLLHGIYGCKYSKSLSSLQTILNDARSNPRAFFERCYELHLQTFHLLIDPYQKETSLHSLVYADWIKSIKDALTQKTFFLTLESGEKILAELYELTEKLKSYDVDLQKITSTYTVRCVRAVLDAKSLAYTKASPIHFVLAPNGVPK